MGLLKGIFGGKDKAETSKPVSISFGGKTITFDDKLKEIMGLETLAMQAYDAKRYREAIDYYNQVVEKAPNEAMYYTRRGTVYEDMGDDNRAKADFEKALQLNPNDYIAQFRMGMLYQRRNDLNSAVSWLRKSYRNQPTYDSVMGNVFNNLIFVHKRVIAYNLGNFLIQLNQPEGLKYIDEVIEHCPDYSYPYFIKGIVMVSQGQFDEGIRLLRKAESLGNPQASQAIRAINGNRL